MKMQFKAGLLSAFILSVASLVVAQDKDDDFYKPWVDYRNGEISVAFDHTPIHFALQAFHAKTGLHIIIPRATETKVVNLRLDRYRLEPAVRSLISNIGYNNFALMYDAAGRPNRAVVLSEKAETAQRTPAQKPAPTELQLTVKERDLLLKELQRWSELSAEARGRIEDRLKILPASENRDQLVKEYGRQVLGLAPEVIAAK